MHSNQSDHICSLLSANHEQTNRSGVFDYVRFLAQGWLAVALFPAFGTGCKFFPACFDGSMVAIIELVFVYNCPHLQTTQAKFQYINAPSLRQLNFDNSNLDSYEKVGVCERLSNSV